VGGDFYDFFLVDHDHIGLVMADVSGKGVPAALFMMISRVLIKSRLQNGESPAQVLSEVNNQLCETNETDSFVTVWLASIQLSTGKGIAANAGHEHPVMRRAGGKYELVVYRHSLPIGTMEGIRFREREFELFPGDSLFVYTDGVAEASDPGGQLFGTDRILEALNADPDIPPQDALSTMMNRIDDFAADAEQFDDITMLCFRYLG
jgi:sigma-B regulation protein RsbU (phosphoserine phosphatase)